MELEERFARMEEYKLTLGIDWVVLTVVAIFVVTVPTVLAVA